MYQLYVGDKIQIEDRLNGSIVLGPFPKSGLAVGALTFITGSGTTTFAGSVGDVLTVAQIVAAINVTDAGLATVRNLQTQAPPNRNLATGSIDPMVLIVLQLDAGFTVDKDGTANPLLKLSVAADTSSAGAVTQADIAGFTDGGNAGSFAVLINS